MGHLGDSENFGPNIPDHRPKYTESNLTPSTSKSAAHEILLNHNGRLVEATWNQGNSENWTPIYTQIIGTDIYKIDPNLFLSNSWWS